MTDDDPHASGDPHTDVESDPEPDIDHDLGVLRPLSAWETAARGLDRRRLVVPLLVTWWLLATMLAQLEDQLAVMHLPGDRSFRVAALEGAGDSLPAVLATWRRWRLANETAFGVSPEMVILNELVVFFLLPVVTCALLAVLSRWAWCRAEPGFRRQVAAAGVVAAPLALALFHLRNALVAVAAFGGLIGLGSIHLLIALAVIGATAAMVAHSRWPGIRTSALSGFVVIGAVGLTAAAALVVTPCGRAGSTEVCSGEPRAGVAAGLMLTGGLSRLLLGAIVAGILLASVERVRAWFGGGGPRRWVGALLAVRGQIVAVVPVVALVVLGTSDLGLQVHNALSRLLESHVRLLGMIAGVVAVMAVLAAFAHRSTRSATAPARTVLPVGAADESEGRSPRGGGDSGPSPWVAWGAAGAAIAVVVVVRLAGWDLIGVQAVAIVVAIVAALSGPRQVAQMVRTTPLAEPAASEVLLARTLVIAVVPLSFASVAARLAVTTSDGGNEPEAAFLLLLLGSVTAGAYLTGDSLARLFAGPAGLAVVAASTVVAVLLALWGAITPTSFGFALGSVLTLLAAVAVIAVAAGWVVIVGNRLPARGAIAAVGFRRIPLLTLVLASVVVSNQIDPVPGSHDVRTIRASPTSAPGGGREIPLAEAFERWAAGTGRPAPSAEGEQRTPVPMVFVATAGGGIKAAYWTSLVLGCLQEGVAASDRCPAGSTIPRESLFAASGISGGSLGLAIDHARHTTSLTGPAPGYDDVLDTALAGDFLAPDIAAMVLRDGPNSLLHTEAWGDRAAVLEDAWAQGFLDAGGRAPGLDDAFFTGTGAGRFPLMILNSASIEDRCRIAVTPLDLAAPTRGRSCVADVLLPRSRAESAVSRTKDVTDFVCPGADLRLSTAALLSARFPFVSPYGQLRPCLEDPETPVRPQSFAVDGGLVESSAAGPIAEVLDAVEPAIEAWERRPENAGLCIAPRLMMIDHGYGLDTLGGPPQAPGQLRAPSAFFSADSAISSAAQQEAAAAFTSYQRRGGCGTADEAVVPFSLALHPGQRAPLGWTLSRTAREEMDGQLRSPATRCRLVAVREWFARRAAAAGEATPPAAGADGCVSGQLPVPAGHTPADLAGAQVQLWRRTPGSPSEVAAQTVADAVGRFDLPATPEAGRSYTLCFRPGEGVGAVSPLGEPLPADRESGPARSELSFAGDRVTRVDPDGPPVPAC